MFANSIRSLLILALLCALLVAAGCWLAYVLNRNSDFVSATVLLDVATGAVCLVWLLLILRVPWDIYFEAGDVLFEMRRSIELGIKVRDARAAYVRRVRRYALLVAVGAHLLSAAVIALLTYQARGRIGYYFAAFYCLAMFFRPATRAYRFLTKQLGEIRGEIKYPREDVVELRGDLARAVAEMRELKESHLRSVDERLRRLDARLAAGEEADRDARDDIRDLRSAVESAERSFRDRIARLSEEVERSIARAFDNRDIVNGLSAFAKLIKHA